MEDSKGTDTLTHATVTDSSMKTEPLTGATLCTDGDVTLKLHLTRGDVGEPILTLTALEHAGTVWKADFAVGDNLQDTELRWRMLDGEGHTLTIEVTEEDKSAPEMAWTVTEGAAIVECEHHVRDSGTPMRDSGTPTLVATLFYGGKEEPRCELEEVFNGLEVFNGFGAKPKIIILPKPDCPQDPDKLKAG